MTTLTIAAAQSISIAGDLAANMAWHRRFMQIAAEQGVQLLVFPELSLTGYERGLAAELAIAPDAEVLQSLRDFAREVGVTSVVGMPIRLSDDSPVLIGALEDRYRHCRAGGLRRFFSRQSRGCRGWAGR